MQLGLSCRTVVGATCVAAVIAVLAACSSSKTTAPATLSDNQVSADLAAAAGVSATTQSSEFATQDTEAGAAGRIVGLLRASRVLGRGMPRASALSGCTTGSFSGTIAFPAADPIDTSTISRTWEFFAAGVCENALVAGTTDSIVFTSTTSADLHTANGDGQTHHDDQRVNWVTGSPALSSASTHVWSGFEAGVDTTSISGDISTSRTYDAASSDTVTSATYPHPRAGAVYPSSGTYSRWVNASVTFSGPSSGNETVARHIVVTFNGTATVPVVVFDASTGAVDLTCEFDLGLGEIVSGSCTS